MIAKIRTEIGFYNSIVFAIFNKGWKSEAIVFNQDYTALQSVKFWSHKFFNHKRNIYIYNCEKDDAWVSKNKVEGYDWVLGNATNKFNKLVVNDVILDRCKEMQSTVEDCDWLDIITKTDADGLMEAAFSFHDSYVKDMYTQSGKQYIRFNTTWGCDILFELEGDVETNLFKDFGHIPVGDDYPLIMDSTILFENGLIYWIDDQSVKNISDLGKDNFHYFCAKNVKWKLII